MKRSRGFLLPIVTAIVLLLAIGFYNFALAEPQQTYPTYPWMLAETKLPADIHPDTLARAPRTKESDFSDPDEQKIVARLARGEDVARWLGPTGTRLQIPEYADAVRREGASRNKIVDHDLEELIVAVATRESGNQSQFINHLEDAYKAHGQALQEIVRLRKDTKGLDPKRAAIIEFGRELFNLPRTEPVSAKVFADMQKNFGKQGTLAIAAHMIAYDVDTLLMRAYDQHMDINPDCKGGHHGCLDLNNPPPSWENPTTWNTQREEIEAEWAARQAKLPSDVDPSTLCRVARTKESDFTGDEEKQIFNKINNEAGSKQLVSRWLGPTGIRLQIPAYAEAISGVGRAIHSKSGVDPRYMELTVAVTTREDGNRQEFINHEDDAIKAYGKELEDVVRLRKDSKGLDPKDAAIIEFGRELFKMPMMASVSSKAFADLEQNFGRRGAMGIIGLMAYYDGNWMLMRVYDQHMDTSGKCPGPHMGCLDTKNLPPAW